MTTMSTSAEPRTVEFLRTLTQLDAVPGHESEVTDFLRDRWSGFGELGGDRLGSVFCVKRGSADEPRILIDSHVDEVGFVVHRVTPAGHIKFLPHRPRQDSGRDRGRPPHLLKPAERERVLDFGDLYVDVGAESHQEAVESYGVRPGCPIVPEAAFQTLANPRLLSSKAFDNRVGVALVTEVLERIVDHPNTVIGAGCVQEEVGMRGARAVADVVRPDVALVLEGPYADDVPTAERSAMQCRLGGGVHVRLYDTTMVTNPRLAEFVIETARASGIPHQIAVWAAGGTNAGAIHQVGRGVPSIVLGVPVRYIHSHVSVMHLDDYEAALSLVLELVAKLDRSAVERIHPRTTARR
ncbi:MAG: M42 family metallopeptidase [Candidatus Eiseniibacteriota bacterium]